MFQDRQPWILPGLGGGGVGVGEFHSSVWELLIYGKAEHKLVQPVRQSRHGPLVIHICLPIHPPPQRGCIWNTAPGEEHLASAGEAGTATLHWGNCPTPSCTP